MYVVYLYSVKVLYVKNKRGLWFLKISILQFIIVASVLEITEIISLFSSFQREKETTHYLKVLYKQLITITHS